MSLHRFIGLLAAVTILQVNLTVAYAACEAVDSHPQSVTAGKADEAHDHATHSHPTDSDETDPPAKDTSSAACCQAMTSCGSVIDLGRVSSIETGELSETDAVRSIIPLPLSRSAAPEPPPPKA